MQRPIVEELPDAPFEKRSAEDMVYRIETVPLPAQVTRRMETLFDERTMREEIREEYRLALACPHCHRDVDLAFPTTRLPATYADELMEMAARGTEQQQREIETIRSIIGAAMARHQAEAYSPMRDSEDM